MLFSELAKTLPDYAKDLRLNVSSLLTEQLLSDQQKWGTIVAVAHACAHKPLIDAVEAEAAAKLSAQALNAGPADQRIGIEALEAPQPQEQLARSGGPRHHGEADCMPTASRATSAPALAKNVVVISRTRPRPDGQTARTSSVLPSATVVMARKRIALLGTYGGFYNRQSNPGCFLIAEVTLER